MKFTVPQFIDVEDKILGPFTTRQFIIMLITAGIIFVTNRILAFGWFVVVALFEFAIGGTFAFFKVNGMPFHFFLLNIVQTFRRPGLRVWDKGLADAQLKDFINAAPPPPPPTRIKKAPIAASKLTELSLVVNTGGVFNPEA